MAPVNLNTAGKCKEKLTLLHLLDVIGPEIYVKCKYRKIFDSMREGGIQMPLIDSFIFKKFSIEHI